MKFSRRRTIKSFAAGASLLSIGNVGAWANRNGSQDTTGYDTHTVDSESELVTFIEGMPKAELHMHVEGSIEPELAFEIAERNRISLEYETVEIRLLDGDPAGQAASAQIADTLNPYTPRPVHRIDLPPGQLIETGDEDDSIVAGLGSPGAPLKYWVSN